MTIFWSVFRTEFRMSILRKGLWLAYGILFVFYFGTIIVGRGPVNFNPMSRQELWASSAQLAFMFNLLLPVVGGISAADRLVRDRTCHVDEVLASTPLKKGTYVFGKYTGVLASVSLPVLICLLAMRAYTIVLGAPLDLLWMALAVFFVINLPAYAFITAFSLVCPLFMPVRVYQILFTGYWFWGNFLSPKVIPTLSGTLLQAGGKVAMEGLFGVSFGGQSAYGPGEVVINFILLAGCIIAALSAGVVWLQRRPRIA